MFPSICFSFASTTAVWLHNETEAQDDQDDQTLPQVSTLYGLTLFSNA